MTLGNRDPSIKTPMRTKIWMFFLEEMEGTLIQPRATADLGEYKIEMKGSYICPFIQGNIDETMPDASIGALASSPLRSP
jgi:hypothetical protein